MTIANRVHWAARMLENVEQDVLHGEYVTVPVLDALTLALDAVWDLWPIIQEHEERERALTKRKQCVKGKSNE